MKQIKYLFYAIIFFSMNIQGAELGELLSDSVGEAVDAAAREASGEVGEAAASRVTELTDKFNGVLKELGGTVSDKVSLNAVQDAVKAAIRDTDGIGDFLKNGSDVSVNKVVDNFKDQLANNGFKEALKDADVKNIDLSKLSDQMGSKIDVLESGEGGGEGEGGKGSSKRVDRAQFEKDLKEQKDFGNKAKTSVNKALAEQGKSIEGIERDLQAAQKDFDDAQIAKSDAYDELNQAQGKLDDANGKLEQAKTELEGAGDDEGAAQTKVDEAQAEVNKAQAEVDDAQVKYDRATEKFKNAEESFKNAESEKKFIDETISERRGVIMTFFKDGPLKALQKTLFGIAGFSLMAFAFTVPGIAYGWLVAKQRRMALCDSLKNIQGFGKFRIRIVPGLIDCMNPMGALFLYVQVNQNNEIGDLNQAEYYVTRAHNGLLGLVDVGKCNVLVSLRTGMVFRRDGEAADPSNPTMPLLGGRKGTVQYLLSDMGPKVGNPANDEVSNIVGFKGWAGPSHASYHGNKTVATLLTPKVQPVLRQAPILNQALNVIKAGEDLANFGFDTKNDVIRVREIRGIGKLLPLLTHYADLIENAKVLDVLNDQALDNKTRKQKLEKLIKGLVDDKRAGADETEQVVGMNIPLYETDGTPGARFLRSSSHPSLDFLIHDYVVPLGEDGAPVLLQVPKLVQEGGKPVFRLKLNESIRYISSLLTGMTYEVGGKGKALSTPDGQGYDFTKAAGASKYIKQYLGPKYFNLVSMDVQVDSMRKVMRERIENGPYEIPRYSDYNKEILDPNAGVTGSFRVVRVPLAQMLEDKNNQDFMKNYSIEDFGEIFQLGTMSKKSKSVTPSKEMLEKIYVYKVSGALGTTAAGRAIPDYVIPINETGNLAEIVPLGLEAAINGEISRNINAFFSLVTSRVYNRDYRPKPGSTKVYYLNSKGTFVKDKNGQLVHYNGDLPLTTAFMQGSLNPYNVGKDLSDTHYVNVPPFYMLTFPFFDYCAGVQQFSQKECSPMIPVGAGLVHVLPPTFSGVPVNNKVIVPAGNITETDPSLWPSINSVNTMWSKNYLKQHTSMLEKLTEPHKIRESLIIQATSVQDVENKNFVYRVFGQGANQFFVFANGPDNSNFEVGDLTDLGEEFGSKTFKYIISLSSGLVYEIGAKNAFQVIHQANKISLHLDTGALYKKLKSIWSGSGQKMPVLPPLDQAILNSQLIANARWSRSLYPLYFSSKTLRIGSDQFEKGQFIYALSQDKKDDYGNAQDYFVTVQGSIDGSIVYAQQLTDNTRQMISLVTGDLYERAGDVISFKDSNVSQNLKLNDTNQLPEFMFKLITKSSGEAVDTQLVNRIANLNVNYKSDLTKNTSNVREDLYPVLPLDQLEKAKDVDPLHQGIKVLSVGSKNKYFFRREITMTEIENGKQVEKQQTIYLDFNASMDNNNDGGCAYYQVINDAKGSQAQFTYSLDGNEAQELRMRYGVYVSSQGVQSLHMPIIDVVIDLSKNVPIDLVTGLPVKKTQKALQNPYNPNEHVSFLYNTQVQGFFANVLGKRRVNTKDAATGKITTRLDDDSYFIDFISGSRYNTIGQPAPQGLEVGKSAIFNETKKRYEVDSSYDAKYKPFFVWGATIGDSPRAFYNNSGLYVTCVQMSNAALEIDSSYTQYEYTQAFYIKNGESVFRYADSPKGVLVTSYEKRSKPLDDVTVDSINKNYKEGGTSITKGASLQATIAALPKENVVLAKEYLMQSLSGEKTIMLRVHDLPNAPRTYFILNKKDTTLVIEQAFIQDQMAHGVAINYLASRPVDSQNMPTDVKSGFNLGCVVFKTLAEIRADQGKEIADKVQGSKIEDIPLLKDNYIPVGVMHGGTYYRLDDLAKDPSSGKRLDLWSLGFDTVSVKQAKMAESDNVGGDVKRQLSEGRFLSVSDGSDEYVYAYLYRRETLYWLNLYKKAIWKCNVSSNVYGLNRLVYNILTNSLQPMTLDRVVNYQAIRTQQQNDIKTAERLDLAQLDSKLQPGSKVTATFTSQQSEIQEKYKKQLQEQNTKEMLFKKNIATLVFDPLSHRLLYQVRSNTTYPFLKNVKNGWYVDYAEGHLFDASGYPLGYSISYSALNSLWKIFEMAHFDYNSWLKGDTKLTLPYLLRKDSISKTTLALLIPSQPASASTSALPPGGQPGSVLVSATG